MSSPQQFAAQGNSDSESLEEVELERLRTINSLSRKPTVANIKEDQETVAKYTDDIYNAAKPDFSGPAVSNYFKTRFTDLIPDKKVIQRNRRLLNPLPGLKQVGRRQWSMIWCAFCCWSWDAYDFFTISVNVTTIAEEMNKTTKEVSWGITLVLMLRVVGALIFGYFGDRYGRRIPLAANMALVVLLKIGTGFVKNYEQFLGVRAIFGIMLGGVYGNATALALDDCPIDARGFISGLVQQGYAFGYILAVIFKRAIADNTKYTWKAMYWFGAGVCFLLVLWILYLPDTTASKRSKEIARFNKDHGIQQPSFTQKVKKAWSFYWLMIIYMVLLMSGFNFMSHGSQDLYPTLLTVRYEFSSNASTVTNCVANLGAIVGGIFVGHMSNFVGRRLSIMICCIVGGALIYPWAFVSSPAINAGAFFLQFCVQGAWGVVPVHLSELSPPMFRSFVVGVSYQLGNLASSASSTIEATIGERFPMTLADGTHIYDYAKVMAIFMGAVFAFLLVVTFLGPEKMNASFEIASGYDEDQEIQQVIAEEIEKVNAEHDEGIPANGTTAAQASTAAATAAANVATDAAADAAADATAAPSEAAQDAVAAKV